MGRAPILVESVINNFKCFLDKSGDRLTGRSESVRLTSEVWRIRNNHGRFQRKTGQQTRLTFITASHVMAMLLTSPTYTRIVQYV